MMVSIIEGIGARIHLFSGAGKSVRFPWRVHGVNGETGRGRAMVVTMRDRSKNRKPLQRGRNLSIEAIQAVQALKRAKSSPFLSSSSSPCTSPVLERVIDSKFRRLLKFDMLAVLRELLRQNETYLALKVFEDIKVEYWYKPQVRLYSDMIAVMATNGLLEKVEFLYSSLKAEKGLEGDIEDFNSLLAILLNHKLFDLSMDCYAFMQSIGCELDRSSFRILVHGLESNGQMGSSAVVRQDAYRYYGESLEFGEEISAGEERSSLLGGWWETWTYAMEYTSTGGLHLRRRYAAFQGLPTLEDVDPWLIEPGIEASWIHDRNPSSSGPMWPTIDGPLGLTVEASVEYARRFFRFGFALLPGLWAVSCLYFWPVLRHSPFFPRLLRYYVIASAIGFTVFSVLLSIWSLTFAIGGEQLFGPVWYKLVMYKVADRLGLRGMF